MIRQTFLRGISLNYAAFVLSVISLFILTPVVVKHLGQSMYGVWAIISSVVAYLNMCSIGIDTAVGKYTAEFYATQKTNKLNMLVSSAVITLLGIGVLISLLLLVFTPFLPQLLNIPSEFHKPAQITFVIMGLNILFLFQARIFENVFFGLQRVDFFYGFNALRIITSFFLILFVLHMGLGIVGMAVVGVLTSLMFFPLYPLLFRKLNCPIRVNLRSFSFAAIKEYVPYSLRTFSLGITSLILYNTDVIVIGFILGASQVTPYIICYRICWYATYIFSGFSSVMFPQFSRLYALKDMDRLHTLFLGISKISVAIMAPIAIILLLFGQHFINLWVGPDNWVGLKVFCLFILMDFLHAIGTPVGIMLQGIGENKWLAYSEMANAGLNLGLSVLLGINFGIMGVVLGTVIAHLLTSTWFTPLLVCRYIKLSLIKWVACSIIPPLLIGIPVGIGAWLFEQNIHTAHSYFFMGIKSIMILCLYFSVIALWGTNSEERRLFLSLLPTRVRALVGVR